VCFALCTNFIYVPVTGRNSPGTDQNKVEPLSMHPANAGGGVRARGDQLLRGGTTFPCGYPAFEARALVQDRSFPVMEGSQPSVPCLWSYILGIYGNPAQEAGRAQGK